MRNVIISVIASLLVLSCNSKKKPGTTTIEATEQAKQKEPDNSQGLSTDTSKPVTKADIERAIEVNKPGASHKALDKLVGNWETTWKIWEAPDAKPIEEKGKASYKWTMKGRFLEGYYTGKMMDQDYEGKFTLGYDNYAKQYVARWINSFESTIVDYTGTSIVGDRNDLEQLKLIGKASSCPVDRKDVTYPYTFKFESAGRFIEEAYGTDKSGKQYLVLQVVHEKIK